jgi:AcrR family transcriptional regulator
VPKAKRSRARGTTGLSDREIARVARELIAAVGVEGLTMRSLATELGVALGATYHHVATKHDLLLLVGRDIYAEITPPPQDGPWDEQIKALMLNMAAIIGQYPGMAAFLMVSINELTPTELNDAVREILRDAGFSERGNAAVMSALFFFVTGMSAGGFADPSAKVVAGRNLQALFDEGLEVLLAGAQARLDTDRKAKRARRPR